MADYGKLENQLGAVRRAWKRTAALSGLAIVCLETLGILTVALLIDWMYQSAPALRLGLFSAVVVAFLALLVRHVVSPLLRRIPQEQLALFVEEHNDKFEGSLITAAELHTAAAQQTPAELADAVIRSAIARGEKLRAGSVVDFRRLRKYGVAAVLVLAVYGAMCLTIPGMGRHAGRVLAPWHVNQQDLPQTPLMKRPIEFSLAKGDASVLRGSAMEIEAALSRPSEDPVVINFRIAGDEKAAWRTVTMAEAPRLNGYAVTLPDINDETEYFVASGPYRSKTCKISVYDPIAVAGVEITTQYPAYLQLPDRVETQPAGDVSAPIGSKVRVRVLTNRPLAGGRLTWQDGSQQPMTIDAAEKTSAFASFEVKADASYKFAVTDVMSQKAEGAAASAVRALKDGPPTIDIKFPTGPVTASPLGEINFEVEASDDFGVASAELVYERRQCPEPSPRRLPLVIRRPAGARAIPDVTQATLRLALEELSPRVMPREVVSYYIECADRKGQKAVSEYSAIIVGPYEAWPTVDTHPPHEPTYLNMKDVNEYIQATWKLQQDKPTMPAPEYAKKCQELADSMIDPDTKAMYPFYVLKKVPPEKRPFIDQHLASAHKALKDADTAGACKDFRIVLAELTLLGLARNDVLMFQGDAAHPRGTLREKNPQDLLAAIMVAVDKAQPPPGYEPELAKQAEQLRKTAAELKKQQDEIAKQAEEIAKAQADPANKGQDDDKTKKDAKALAAKQDELADKTRKEGEKAKDAADPQKKDPDVKNATGRIEDASRAMKEAARNMNDNKMEQAVADAKRAAAELGRAAEKLDNIRQEKLAAAIAQAEAQAGKALKEQKELTKDTEGEAKDAPKGNDAQKDKEFKKLAVRQAQIQGNVKELMKGVDELHKWAQREGKAETTKHIQESNNQINRGEADQKMANAVVELAAKRADAAGEEQQAAQKALEGAVAALRKASDSLAADRESELKRAANEAKKIAQDLRKLGAEAKDPTAPAKDPAKTDEPGKKDPLAKDDDKGPAKPLSEKEKKELAEDLSYDLGRFAEHLENREFASKEEVSTIRQAATTTNQLGPERPADKRKLDELSSLVHRVRDKLETEYQATLERKKLMAAQREECPPSYRQLVNKYYEALSESGN